MPKSKPAKCGFSFPSHVLVHVVPLSLVCLCMSVQGVMHVALLLLVPCCVSRVMTCRVIMHYAHQHHGRVAVEHHATDVVDATKLAHFTVSRARQPCTWQLSLGMLVLSVRCSHGIFSMLSQVR